MPISIRCRGARSFRYCSHRFWRRSRWRCLRPSPLATALGARALAKLGVLPTRLSAVDEAATIDVLVFGQDGNPDPQRAFSHKRPAHAWLRRSPHPRAGGSGKLRWRPGLCRCGDSLCFLEEAGIGPAKANQVCAIRPCEEDVGSDSDRCEGRRTAHRQRSLYCRRRSRSSIAHCGRDSGRTRKTRLPGLGGSCGPPASMQIVASSRSAIRPARTRRHLISELKTLGVRTVMVTGDAPATAAIVAHAVGLDGAVCPPGPHSQGRQARRLRGIREHSSRREI